MKQYNLTKNDNFKTNQKETKDRSSIDPTGIESVEQVELKKNRRIEFVNNILFLFLYYNKEYTYVHTYLLLLFMFATNKKQTFSIRNRVKIFMKRKTELRSNLDQSYTYINSFYHNTQYRAR